MVIATSPLFSRLLVGIEYWHLSHGPHSAIGRENIEYGVSKSMELLLCVVSIGKPAILAGELHNANRKDSLITRLVLLPHFAKLNMMTRLLTLMWTGL